MIRRARKARRARRGGVKDSEKVAIKLTRGFIGDITEHYVHCGKV